MMASCTIRAARLADKNDILSSNVDAFGGIDNLDFYYDKYMDDPSMHCFVVEINGHAVAFRYIYITDDGETAVRGGARTHIKFRHKGYQEQLLMYFRDVLLPQFPNAKRYISVTFEAQFYLDRIENENSTIFLRRGNRSFKTKEETLLESIESPEFQKLHTKYQCSSTVQKEENDVVPFLVANAAKLFPKEHFLVWEPYRAIESSLRTAVRRCEQLLSFDNLHENKLSAVTFVTFVTTKGGKRVDFEFYGEDSIIQIRHILYWLKKRMNSFSRTQIWFHINLMFHEHLDGIEYRDCSQKCFKTTRWRLEPIY